MRNIRLTLSYEGTHFSGWQYQPHDRTVQGAIEAALSTILAHDVRVTGSGRTDAGVHALEQTANFRTEARIECAAVKRALNALLPPDVRILDVGEVPDSFDSRRSAIRRVYRYLVYTGPVVSPFMRRYVWHLHAVLDVDAMRRAGSVLVGLHDFASFAGHDEENTSTMREVTSFCVDRLPGDIIRFEIGANAFLRHMVRAIIGTIVRVGRGRTTEIEFSDILTACDRNRAGMTAPPHGLYLVKVHYS